MQKKVQLKKTLKANAGAAFQRKRHIKFLQTATQTATIRVGKLRPQKT